MILGRLRFGLLGLTLLLAGCGQATSPIPAAPPAVSPASTVATAPAPTVLPAAPSPATPDGAATRPASPAASPTRAASPTVPQAAASPARAASPAAPRATASPSPASAAVRPAPSPAPAPSGRIALDPAGRWSIHPPAGLNREALGDAVTLFISPDRSTFVAVDSFVADGTLAGNTGEGLRNRARDTLARIYGREVTTTGVVERGDLGAWEQGITFSTDQGSTGRALYRQPGRETDDFRVYGVLIGSRPPGAVSQERLIAAADSFLPLTALDLPAAGGRPAVTVLSTYDLRSFQPDAGSHHLIAVYRAPGGRWEEVSRAYLTCPDYLGEGSVTAVPIAPDATWLQVAGGAGAHAGCYDIFRFDGQSLRHELEYSHPSPDAGFTRDVLNEGRPQVVLNRTDPYVFCYACGVRDIAYGVLRWNGSAFEEVDLTLLPESAPAEVRRLTNSAVAEAQAGLWKEAQGTIGRAVALDPRVPGVQRNAALIDLTGTALAAAVRETGYPLLQIVFYGDYPAAVDLMRPYAPAEIFGQRSPLIQGTPAEGWLDSLAGHLARSTSDALAVRPDLAEAHYLRGWAAYLRSPGSTEARTAVERAAQLRPNDSLFRVSAEYLRGAGGGSG